MDKQLIGSIQMHMKDMLSSFALFVGVACFGTLIMSIVFWTDETETSWICVGTLIALVVMIFFAVLNFLSYHQEFMLALSMGQTRRDFLITYALCQMFWMIASYVVILLINQMEQMYYTSIFPDKEQAIVFSFLTDWKFVTPFIPGMAVLSMFLGSLYSRFGRKFGVVVYFIWIGACIFLPRFINHWDEYTGPLHEEIGTFTAWIFMIPPVAWTVLALVTVLIMSVTIIHFGMKQMVR